MALPPSLLGNTTNSTISPDDVSEPSSFATAIIYFISGLALLVILGGNGLVIILIVKFSRLRTATNYFILGMASADFALGIIVTVVIIMKLNHHWPMPQFGCLLLRCTTLFPAVTSCLTLLSVSMDRYLKIVMPLRYHDLMSKRVAMMIVISIFVYTALTIYVLPLTISNGTQIFNQTCWVDFSLTIIHPAYLQFLVFGNILLPLCLICIMYGQIFRTVIQMIGHERSIRIPQQQAKKMRYMTSRRSSRNWITRELRTIKTLVILLGLCIFGWVPFCGVVLFEIYNPSYQVGLKVLSVIRMCTSLNSAANPIVYSLRSEQFRLCIRKLFGITKKHSNVTNRNNTIS
ncbi:beta-2 adrenergic receptor-like [Amphiura filiformis]|uniref:beta-2 adrenergic receptor-like n=1 Tax=Amphiura filiformis TaxID=82378 RepID=UPI003B20F34C